MADNIALRDGNGVLFTLRTKDLGTGHAYFAMVVTAAPTVLTGNQTITLSTTVDATLTVPAGATHGLATVDASATGNMRYWEDGSSPSTTTGLEVPAGSGAELTNLANVKCRATAASAVQVSYRKYS